jgi:hypothetical protein
MSGKFKVGDRVKTLIESKYLGDGGGYRFKIGDSGTVICQGNNFGVKLDSSFPNPHLHDCRGSCETGYGWHFAEDELELYNEVPIKRFLSDFKRTIRIIFRILKKEVA